MTSSFSTPKAITISERGEFAILISLFFCIFHFNGKLLDPYRCLSIRSFDKSNEWNQAETLMSDYRTILERRESLNSESALMKRQNAQLETDLKKHLNEKVNEELRFPPSCMISVSGEGAK
jgi:hypothetical protein